MFNKFILKVSLRYFIARKREKLVSIITVFSVLGILLGVASLIIVMSVMNGFRNELVSNIRGLNGDIIITSKYSNFIENSSEIINDIKEISGIQSIHKVVSGQILLNSDTQSRGAILKGITIDHLASLKQIINKIKYGNLNSFYQEDNILIGIELMKNLEIGPKSSLKIITPSFVTSMLGPILRHKDVNVAAIYKSNMYDYDSLNVIMPFKFASKLLSTKNNPNLIEIFLNNENYVDKISKEIKKRYKNILSVKCWHEIHSGLLNALKIERSAMFMVLTLIIIVAAFNIISSLFMLVKEKTREIAILRTMGASRYSILTIFIISGTFTGILGTSLGVISGILFSKNIDTIRTYLESFTNIVLFEPAIYFLYYLPSKLQIYDIILVSFISLSLSFIATIYPAYKASSIDPSTALKNE